MSFSFSFSGEDIDSSDHEDTTTTKDITKKLEDASITSQSKLLRPKRHTFAELLESLPDQVSYNRVDIPISEAKGRRIGMPRREIFDIRQQLMAEADPSQGSDTTGTLLEGLQSGDLSTGIYEGGFKTWECAIDLAGYLHDLRYGEDEFDTTIIELGAGSAIPSLVLLVNALIARNRNRAPSEYDDGRTVRFVLCDYNEDVLRLCTAVNVFILVALNLPIEPRQTSDSITDLDSDLEVDMDHEKDLTIDKALIDRVLGLLKKLNIEIEFISGAWSDEFVNLALSKDTDADADAGGTSTGSTLTLASETIYSPDAIAIFTKTLLSLQRKMPGVSQACKALVAAKKVYFGVGGGVAEFEAELQKHGGTAQSVLDVEGAGVGRVVLDVTA